MVNVYSQSERERYYRTLTRVGEAVDITLREFWEKDPNKPLKTRYADYLREEYDGLRRRIINHDD